MKQKTNVVNNEMRFIGPRSHLEEEYPVDMVALNLTNRSRKGFYQSNSYYNSYKTNFLQFFFGKFLLINDYRIKINGSQSLACKLSQIPTRFGLILV